MRTMKKVLTSVCAFALALTVMVMPVSAAEFDDMVDHWGKAYVERWADADLIVGKSDGVFDPDGEITRAELAAIVAKMAGVVTEKSHEAEFSDVNEDDWFYHQVLSAADAGFVSGRGDGVFDPYSSVTREQAFTMIISGLGIDESLYEATASDYVEEFVDADEISDWAVPFIAATVANNGVSGMPDGNGGFLLKPQDPMTRAQATAVLDGMVALYVNESGEVSEHVERTTATGEKEDYIGHFVVVNAKQNENVAVTVEKDEETGTVAINIVVKDETGNVKEEKTTVVDTASTENETKPTVVHGTTSAPLEDNQTIVVEKVEEESGSEQPTEQKHVHMAGKPENCAVTGLYSDVCYTDVNCADVVEKTWQADVHNFVDGKCKVCGMKETADAMKFHANITSNGEYVDVNVTNDYAAKMVITPGKVDASKATVTVEMQDVASLGVNNLRSETKTFNTGLTGDPALNVWLSEAFDFGEGQVNAVIEDKETKAVKETSYELAGSTDAKGNAVIAATPASVEATREAWAEITKHVASETQTEEDSYIVIANGSYMVVYDDMLCFEKGNVGDLKLDAFSTEGGLAALEDEIRSKVQLNSSEKFAMDGHEFQFYLAAGTKIAVSNSIATLTDDCFITVNSDALENGKDLKELGEILPELQAAENGYAMAEKLVKLLNKMIGAADSKYSVDVHMTFSEPEAEKDTKFYFGVTANNADGKGTTTVDMEVYDDYSLEINLPMNKISASEVTLDVEMNNVASLGVTGTKKHSQTVNTGMTATGDLNFWMSNAPKFEGAMINTTIVDADGEAFVSYNLESDMDADWVTITGTTNTEHARAAWAKIANNVATSENTKGDDSYILVNKNSFVQIGTEMLDFEDGADDMLLDNFSNLNAVKQEIKDSVKLVNANEDKIVLYVGAGTTLAVSESAATLEKDAEIVVSLSSAIPGDTLSKIQAAADDNNALVKELFTLLNNMIGSMNNEVVDVQISFLEPVKECDHLQERRTNCAVAETAYCECGAAQFDLIAIPHTFENEVCNVCGMTEDEAMKFEAKISSNGNYVETVVTNDYAAQVTVTPGNVDASKVDLYVAMQDVASLDVTGKREESKSLSTGLSGNPALNVWLSNAFGFTSGKIEATVEGLPTGYELKGASVNGNAVITATPVNVEHTRAAWEELTKFVTTESQSSSDSYVEIANGSFMIVGDDMLSFEDDVEGNLKLDGFTANNGMDSVENEIRSKVKLTTDASLASDDYEAKFYLAKGTKLAISNSIATIDENCVITLWGDGLKGEDFANILPELQKAESGYAMAEKLVKMINAMIGSANGNTVGIDITFIEQPLNAPVVMKVEAIDVTPVYSANTVVVEEVVEETTEEPVVEEVVEEATEEPAVEEVVEEETTEEPVVEEVVEEEITEEPVVEEVVEEETTEEPVVEEVVEEAAEEPAAE